LATSSASEQFSKPVVPQARSFGAILLVEAADAAAAQSGLEKLPFVERDLIAFELIELADD
jgi:hypothetical protein